MQIAYREEDRLLHNLSWEKALAKVETEIEPQIFAAYIKALEFSSLDLDSSKGELAVSSKFIAKQVQDNYLKLLESNFAKILGIDNLSLKINVLESKKSGSVQVVKKTRVKKEEKVANNTESNVDSKYTFDSFVVGNSNQFCNAAALRVAENPGNSYNPLFIYGGVGLGKTHLMHAIGNAVLSKMPGKRVLYISSEVFTNELIQALRTGKMDSFKVKLREIDLLLIDDIQFIAGKERTQEEFFHTFNSLYSAKKQIVMSSDKIPQELPGIEERLRTRFSWGLTADLQVPDLETRIAILKKKSLQEGFNLPEDVAALMSENISSNVRELEGALTRLQAVSSLQGKAITVELAKTALHDIFEPKRINIKIADIKAAVGVHFSIPVSDLSSKRRTRNLSFPRHIAMYLCRKHTTSSYPEIGAQFGGRDHSSVIHAASVVSEKIKKDLSIKSTVSSIEKILLG